MTLEEAEKKFDLPPGRLKQYVSFGFIKGTGSAGDAPANILWNTPCLPIMETCHTVPDSS